MNSRKGSLFAGNMVLPTPDILAEIARFLSTGDAFNLIFSCRETVRLARVILAGRQLECVSLPRTDAVLPTEVLRRCLETLGVHLSKMAEPQNLIDGSAANLVVLREWGLTLEDVRSDGGRTLQWAAAFGDVKVVRALREWGLTAKDARASNNCALFLAASYGHAEVVRELRGWGLTLEDARTNSNDPIRSAAEQGYVGVLRALREWGMGAADALAGPMPAFRLATMHGHAEALREMRGWGLAAEDIFAEGHQNALAAAVCKGHVAVLRELSGWCETADDAQAMLGMLRRYDFYGKLRGRRFMAGWGLVVDRVLQAGHAEAARVLRTWGAQ